ncbi:unnamed protein product [Haemonchus placei]|uniref:G_PROTEIN_RECEP_F1_2 domain-containing protein n=1 Tax=Haemonchus placei TaxID=6290 RepID=A0A0N4WZG2_HAEPC|nr:unnamed protein product [Haemonchus placei]
MNSTSLSGAAAVANVAYCYVLPVVCTVGIIGNITNLIVLNSRRLRAVSYMYLRALAIADLLCMVFVLAFVTTEILSKNGAPINQYKLYRIYQCHFMLTLINWALGAGVYVVVALSLERYISIVFPMHFRAWNSPTRASNAIIMAFTIPALLYVPYALTRYKSIEKWDENANAITYKIDDHQVYRTTSWQVLRFLPIIALSILNIQIIVAFRKRLRMFQQLTKRKEQGAHKDDTLMYMLGGTVFMSLLCNIPAAINLLLIDEVSDSGIKFSSGDLIIQVLKRRLDYQIFRAVANILEITNHASQFYVFCACSTDYRTTFLHKFPCFKKAYKNTSRMRSFVKRTQTVITREKESFDHPSLSAKVIDPRRLMLQDVVLLEPETIDVHLASVEHSLSDERRLETLLKYGAIAKLPTDTNGSTFL